MRDYAEHFRDDQIESCEVKHPLKEGMQRWLEVFRMPNHRQTTYVLRQAVQHPIGRDHGWVPVVMNSGIFEFTLSFFAATEAGYGSIYLL